MPLLSFIIPVRHQDNARDWGQLKAKLAETIASIDAQTNADWRGYVVANHGADLPPLPARFEAVRVDFPPNDLHDLASADRAGVEDAFRFDKGRRVLAGMLAARDSRYFMICDDDDLVSRSIVDHVARHDVAGGYVIERGYIWADGSRFLLTHDDFNHLCGTSLIIRSDSYRLPPSFEAASVDWIKSMLGSHRQIGQELAEAGTPLVPLPFPGAIYRVGHAGSHSQTTGVMRGWFFSRHGLSNPFRAIANLLRLRPFAGVRAAEFRRT